MRVMLLHEWVVPDVVSNKVGKLLVTSQVHIELDLLLSLMSDH